ncbi:sulfotransferase [Lacipirellula parvula]|nr:sulfotransferase [Lacipirellula parvula]
MESRQIFHERVKPFIFVLGVPSGGTSCVAHLVRLLGVDMGRIPTTKGPHGRSYSTCEDEAFFRRVVNHHCPWHRPLPTSSPQVTALAIQEYVAFRRRQPTSAMTLGCKGWVNWGATDEKFWQIPDVHVINVVRPLEGAMKSFMKYQQAAPDHSAQAMVLAAARLGALWQMKEIAVLNNPTKIFHIDFEELKSNPLAQVERIAKWLPHHPSDTQIGSAVISVHQGK